MKTEKEIQEMADEAATNTRNFSAMTYQDGILAALEWVLEIQEESPLE